MNNQEKLIQLQNDFREWEANGGIMWYKFLLDPDEYVSPRELFSLIVFPYNIRTNHIDSTYQFIDECYDPDEEVMTTPWAFLQNLIQKGEVVRSPLKDYDAFIFVAVEYGLTVNDFSIKGLMSAYYEDEDVAGAFMVLDTDGDAISGFRKGVTK